MDLVAIESPYAGDVEANVAYAKRCVRDCLSRGESPYASHLFFTQDGLLDDTKPDERKLGIESGLEWSAQADLVAVYVDRGFSGGMKLGIHRALLNHQRIQLRALDRPVTDGDFQELLPLVAKYNRRVGPAFARSTDPAVYTNQRSPFPCGVCGKMIWRGWFALGVAGGPPKPVKCGACSNPPREEEPSDV